MPRLTEQEQQEIIRFIEADKPLPDKYPFKLLNGLLNINHNAGQLNNNCYF